MTVMCQEEGKAHHRGVGREVLGFPHPPENSPWQGKGVTGDPADRVGTASAGVSPSTTSVVTREGRGLQTEHQTGHHPEPSQLPGTDPQPRQPHVPAPQHHLPPAPAGTGTGSAGTCGHSGLMSRALEFPALLFSHRPLPAAGARLGPASQLTGPSWGPWGWGTPRQGPQGVALHPGPCALHPPACKAGAG